MYMKDFYHCHRVSGWWIGSR